MCVVVLVAIAAAIACHVGVHTARGEDAMSVLACPKTRDMFVNELQEVRLPYRNFNQLMQVGFSDTDQFTIASNLTPYLSL